MNKFQVKVASIFTMICFLLGISLIIISNVCPGLIINEKIIYILILGSLPWLTLFFKEIKLPGGAGAVTHDRIQSSTKKPLPPISNIQSQDDVMELILPAKKVLATLGKYQKQHFGNNLEKRWTFAVFPQAQAYPNYLSGLSELVQRGFVTVSPENYQCMLTNEGIEFLKNNPDIQTYSDLYTF